MATLTRVTLVEVGKSFTGGTAGQAAGFQAASGGGDKVPIGSGRGTLVTVKTAGTATNVTFDSTRLSEYGADQNIVMALGATDEQEIFLVNDGYGRFDAGGADAGLVNVTYSATTNVSIKAKTIP